MKGSGKRKFQQLHLPLSKESKAVLSADKRRELALALIDLLASAIDGTDNPETSNEPETSGGEDEF
jgi:hypothetical protein